MVSLRNSDQPANEPHALVSIFRKLHQFNARLPYHLIEEALTIQFKRYSEAKNEKNFASLLAEFEHPTAEQDVPVQSLIKKPDATDLKPVPNRMHLPPTNRITKPHPVTRDKIREDAYTVDMEEIGEDLVTAIKDYFEVQNLDIDLTRTEKEFLGFHP